MMYLVLDRLEGGSVDALRKQRGYLEEGFAAYIIAQVVDAVRYCHSLDIAVRRDKNGQTPKCISQPQRGRAALTRT